jgi:sugar/nucleoside kinase (ribokinase family)
MWFARKGVFMVVSLGVHILDVLGRYVSEIPAGQNLALLEEIRMTVAGTAAGTSVDLAKLGADVVAMGALGDDEAGNFVQDTMNRYGINTEYMVRKTGVQTSASMLPIRPNGERPALHVVGANGEFTLDDVNFEVLAKADVLHLGGTYVMPKFDGQPSAEVLKFAQENGVITTLDMLAIAKDDMLGILEPCLPHIDYFMPGLDEAKLICGLDTRQEVIDFFLDKGVKHTVFKMGADGSSIAGRDMDEIRLPALNVPVVDSTGCGDAYCAGFIVGLTKGYSLEDAGKLGTAAAAQVITGLGSDAGIKDFAGTLEFMNHAETLPMTDV